MRRRSVWLLALSLLLLRSLLQRGKRRRLQSEQERQLRRQLNGLYMALLTGAENEQEIKLVESQLAQLRRERALL